MIISKNRFIKLLAISLCLICISANVFAQSKTYNEEITVVAPYDPIIPDAFKISRNPVADDTLAKIPVMSYTIMPRVADVKLGIEPIAAVKLVAEPLSKLYRNYIRAGAGNYSSLYGELFISSLRSKKNMVSLRLKHQSAAGTIKDFGPSDNSRDEAELNGTKYLSQHTLSGNAFYSHYGLHLYGFKPSDLSAPLSKDDIRQRYITTGAKIVLASDYKSDERLNHTIGLAYYYMAGLYKNNEHNVNLSANLDKKYDLFRTAQKQTIGISLGLDFLSQKDSIRHIKSAIVGINPFIKASVNEYSFMVGFKMNLSIDSVTNAYIYPMAEAKLEIIPNALRVYAGISGGLERTSLRGISSQNAFISSVLPWNYVNEKFKAYGGFHSNISRSFNFNGSISSSTIENNPFFVTDTSFNLLNSFSLLYDDITHVKISGELEYVRFEKLRISLTGSYNHYKLTQQAYAWYKPTYEFGLSGRYNIQDKIIVSIKANVNGTVWALKPQMIRAYSDGGRPVYVLNPEKLKGWTDVSLGGEYRINKALSCWLNLNNLTNSTYYRWLNYPSYGLNVMAGLSYSF